MLKLRNAVLTALLAFCLAMPFVSCSFNDGATGDVSDKVTVQSDNNQNGGNENPSGGDNGGNGGSTGGNENPSGGNNDFDFDCNYRLCDAEGNYLGRITGDVLKSFDNQLTIGIHYNVDEEDITITLTSAGYEKLKTWLIENNYISEGGDSGSDYPGTDYPGTDYPGTDYPGTDYPGTDYPGTDYPGTDEPGTEYPGTDEPDYGDEIVYTIMYSGAEITTIPESGLSFYVDTFGLVAGDDYTISETTITLTESGFNKLSGDGE